MLKRVPIGDYVTLRQGFAINAKSKQYISEKVTSLNLLRIADMKSQSFGIYLKESIPQQFIAKDTDIIYTRTGQVGLVFVNQKGVVHNNCFTVTSKDEDVLSREFLIYVLRNNDFYRTANSLASGSAQPDLSHSAFKTIEIDLPDISSQRKIASILSSLDRKIELNNEINAKLEEMAQALFRSWLKGCKDIVTIGDISLNITDYTKCISEQVVLVNSSDVTEGFFDHHILSENKDLKGHFKKRFKKGDILYSQVRPRNRHWAYCQFDADDYIASTQLMIIRNKPEKISSVLLYLYLTCDEVWQEFTLKTETRSGTFPQGNYEEMSAIKVPYDKDYQEISNTIRLIYDRLQSLNVENRHLAETRDALLPKLMSGEIEI